MPTAWFSIEKLEYYHVRWCCDRRREIDADAVSEMKIEQNAQELRVNSSGKIRLLQLCEICLDLILRETKYD